MTTADEARRKRTLVEALYKEYGQTLRSFLVRRRLSQDQVADVVQETYYRVQQADSVESIRHPRAFLLRVANNVLLNARKSHRNLFEECTPDIDSFNVAAEDPSAYRQLSAEQELAIVRAALLELPPKCREAFVMNRFENLSYPQIARELNLSVSMIEKYISQALAHMRHRVLLNRPRTTRSLRGAK
ncbi:RNA polymerase sigma factor [Steroidobacter sp.]|uniref:RNA polymerase sigma factor n=1 Tax=Steroidobacter sp. TaxID=1978227 RepID=UPI001A491DA4|nr:sigma-70 family RNA polymerase sigma factor [Steroidobacter sp.]MBL8266377.1 sigma-70 family RNA polymerase sigma factor [Steroidobacter sp.]